MDERTGINRREFTAATVLAMLSGVSITISGCAGGGGTSGSPTGPTPAGGVTGAVSANHGHNAMITDAQINAGGDVELDITGSADHPHSVTLAAGQVMQIDAGMRVSVESSTDAGHLHIVTFN